MHLLAAQPGTLDEGEAVDPGQTPADLVVVSAADTEIAALSAARAAMEASGDAPPSLRLAQLLHLRHPMSVDLHLDACATRSGLVVARVLGGRGYWPYGTEQYAARCGEAGVPLALLPGDDREDAELRGLSTVPAADYDALWAFLVEGGPTNAARFLAHAAAMLGHRDRPPPAEPLLRAGAYWPGHGATDLATIRAAWADAGPVAPRDGAGRPETRPPRAEAVSPDGSRSSAAASTTGAAEVLAQPAGIVDPSPVAATSPDAASVTGGERSRAGAAADAPSDRLGGGPSTMDPGMSSGNDPTALDEDGVLPPQSHAEPRDTTGTPLPTKRLTHSDPTARAVGDPNPESLPEPDRSEPRSTSPKRPTPDVGPAAPRPVAGSSEGPLPGSEPHHDAGPETGLGYEPKAISAPLGRSVGGSPARGGSEASATTGGERPRNADEGAEAPDDPASGAHAPERARTLSQPDVAALSRAASGIDTPVDRAAASRRDASLRSDAPPRDHTTSDDGTTAFGRFGIDYVEGDAPIATAATRDRAAGAPAADASDPAPVPGASGGRAVVPVIFYRALLQGAGLNPVNRIVRALLRAGLAPLPVFVASLKDPLSLATLKTLLAEARPDAILNLTSFSAGPLDQGCPVFQGILSAATEEQWRDAATGLPARDVAMNVALPEIDGRVLTRALGFKGEAFFDAATECSIATWKAAGDRIAWTADLIARWCRLRRTPPSARRVALILANYPTRDGRIANGVGLDTPAATVEALRALREAGYDVGGAPDDPQALMEALLAGPTNAPLGDGTDRRGGIRWPVPDYVEAHASVPWAAREAQRARWGAPKDDPRVENGHFILSLHRFGNVTIGIQPARGYDVDPNETYHDPDLVPPHNYLAFYAYLRHSGVDAVVHMGKHGNLEWLPGKAVGLAEEDWPEIALGPVPNVYPFIVNDPGEGTQAKRRAGAVIVDHLTPPLTRAESYGPQRDLEALVDEYYEAAGLDPRRCAYLRDEILSLARATGLDVDVGMRGDAEDDLSRLDAYLCDLKEAQIRDGLHVFGRAPEGRLADDLLAALLRIPRAAGASLPRAVAEDLGLGFDPLDCDMAAPWEGPRPGALATVPAAAAGGPVDPLGVATTPPDGGDAPTAAGLDGARRVGGGSPAVRPSVVPARPTRADAEGSRVDAGSSGDPGGRSEVGPATLGPWRSHGDTVERIELLALRLLRGEVAAPGPATAAVLEEAETLRATIAACGAAERAGLLTALDGGFVPPGPSGAPTRGRPDVLPTGRNFFSVDSRAVPTPTAWALGWKSADLLIERHLQDHGDWPRAMLLTAWGTANMRTGGDDVAQCLALMGVRPRWDAANRRVVGYEIIPHTALGRPRVDVTFRVSGFFRDAFPQQMALIDEAARAVQALDEPDAANPAAARARAGEGRARVYGSKPGAYGAGLQAMIDERLWSETADLGRAYVEWGGYAYADGAGAADHDGLRERLGQVEAIVQNQDNREHDLLDSDDYYQFEGGAAAAVEMIRGARVPVWHNDHSRPERPVIRSLEEEVGRVVRSRVANPKWIAGVMRHGYKGAFEIAASVDYLFAFAATTGAVRDHHFDLVHAAVLEDDAVRDWMAAHNAPALREVEARLREAIERGLWTPRSNSARMRLMAG